MTEEKIPKKSVVAKKIRKRRLLLILLIIAAFVSVCLFTPLFGITSITVKNNQVIDNDSIIRASGIKVGENVFRVNLSSAEKAVEKLGHVEKAVVKRKFPSRIVIEVTESNIAAYIMFAGNYVAIDINGKVIDVIKTGDIKADKPVVTGIALKSFDKGEVFTASKAKKGKFVTELLLSLKKNELLVDVKKIDISNVNSAKMILNTETTVVVGDSSQLDYKMAYLIEVLKNLENLRGGEIDMSDTKNVIFKGGK